MALVPIEQQAAFKILWDAASIDAQTGVVAATQHERKLYWKFWKSFLKRMFPTLSPYLENNRGQTIDLPETIGILAAYCRYVRAGEHLQPYKNGKKREVRASAVSLALQAISTRCKLDGKHNIVVGTDQKYHKILAEQLESYKPNNLHQNHN